MLDTFLDNRGFEWWGGSKKSFGAGVTVVSFEKGGVFMQSAGEIGYEVGNREDCCSSPALPSIGHCTPQIGKRRGDERFSPRVVRVILK